jgi:hypothetical protein
MEAHYAGVNARTQSVRALLDVGARYFVGFHSRASRCASAIWSEVITFGIAPSALIYRLASVVDADRLSFGAVGQRRHEIG